MKTNLTRRTVVKGGMALATAGTLTGSALLEWAKAWAQTAQWIPERGAQLSLLRWKYFVQAEDEAFVAAMDAFTKATGVKINLIRESGDDIQPKASVAANIGAGPDLIWGYYSLPHLFANKCLDVTDVADYLGGKYDGWARRAPLSTEKALGIGGSESPCASPARLSIIGYRPFGKQATPNSPRQLRNCWITPKL
jgi:multiple sugar transport system substrate-binding protein